MFPVRQELVGKRVVFYPRENCASSHSRNGACTPVETHFGKPFADLREQKWVSGVIHEIYEDEKAKENTKLFIECHGKQQKQTNWFPINQMRNVYVEWSLVLAKPTWFNDDPVWYYSADTLWPAFAMIPYVNGKLQKILDYNDIPVLFVGCEKFAFTIGQGITTINDASDKVIKKVQKQVMVPNPVITEELRKWEQIQKSQILLLQGPYTLDSCTVFVYSTRKKAWHSGVIAGQDLISRMIEFNDWVTCETEEIDPRSTHVIFDNTDSELNALLKGNAPTRSRQMRRSNGKEKSRRNGNSSTVLPIFRKPFWFVDDPAGLELFPRPNTECKKQRVKEENNEVLNNDEVESATNNEIPVQDETIPAASVCEEIIKALPTQPSLENDIEISAVKESVCEQPLLIDDVPEVEGKISNANARIGEANIPNDDFPTVEAKISNADAPTGEGNISNDDVPTVDAKISNDDNRTVEAKNFNGGVPAVEPLISSEDDPTDEAKILTDGVPTVEAKISNDDNRAVEAKILTDGVPAVKALISSEDDPTDEAKILTDGVPTGEAKISTYDVPTIGAKTSSDDFPTAEAKISNDDAPTVEAKISNEDVPTVQAKISIEDVPTVQAKISNDDDPTVEAKTSNDDFPPVEAKISSNDVPTAEASMLNNIGSRKRDQRFATVSDHYGSPVSSTDNDSISLDRSGLGKLKNTTTVDTIVNNVGSTFTTKRFVSSSCPSTPYQSNHSTSTGLSTTPISLSKSRSCSFATNLSAYKNPTPTSLVSRKLFNLPPSSIPPLETEHSWSSMLQNLVLPQHLLKSNSILFGNELSQSRPQPVIKNTLPIPGPRNTNTISTSSTIPTPLQDTANPIASSDLTSSSTTVVKSVIKLSNDSDVKVEPTAKETAGSHVTDSSPHVPKPVTRRYVDTPKAAPRRPKKKSSRFPKTILDCDITDEWVPNQSSCKKDGNTWYPYVRRSERRVKPLPDQFTVVYGSSPEDEAEYDQMMSEDSDTQDDSPTNAETDGISNTKPSNDHKPIDSIGENEEDNIPLSKLARVPSDNGTDKNNTTTAKLCSLSERDGKPQAEVKNETVIKPEELKLDSNQVKSLRNRLCSVLNNLFVPFKSSDTKSAASIIPKSSCSDQPTGLKESTTESLEIQQRSSTSSVASVSANPTESKGIDTSPAALTRSSRKVIEEQISLEKNNSSNTSNQPYEARSSCSQKIEFKQCSRQEAIQVDAQQSTFKNRERKLGRSKSSQDSEIKCLRRGNYSDKTKEKIGQVEVKENSHRLVDSIASEIESRDSDLGLTNPNNGSNDARSNDVEASCSLERIPVKKAKPTSITENTNARNGKRPSTTVSNAKEDDRVKSKVSTSQSPLLQDSIFQQYFELEKRCLRKSIDSTKPEINHRESDNGFSDDVESNSESDSIPIKKAESTIGEAKYIATHAQSLPIDIEDARRMNAREVEDITNLSSLSDDNSSRLPELKQNCYQTDSHTVKPEKRDLRLAIGDTNNLESSKSAENIPIEIAQLPSNAESAVVVSVFSALVNVDKNTQEATLDLVNSNEYLPNEGMSASTNQATDVQNQERTNIDPGCKYLHTVDNILHSNAQSPDTPSTNHNVKQELDTFFYNLLHSAEKLSKDDTLADTVNLHSKISNPKVSTKQSKPVQKEVPRDSRQSKQNSTDNVTKTEGLSNTSRKLKKDQSKVSLRNTRPRSLDVHLTQVNSTTDNKQCSNQQKSHVEPLPAQQNLPNDVNLTTQQMNMSTKRNKKRSQRSSKKKSIELNNKDDGVLVTNTTKSDFEKHATSQNVLLEKPRSRIEPKELVTPSPTVQFATFYESFRNCLVSNLPDVRKAQQNKQNELYGVSSIEQHKSTEINEPPPKPPSHSPILNMPKETTIVGLDLSQVTNILKKVDSNPLTDKPQNLIRRNQLEENQIDPHLGQKSTPITTVDSVNQEKSDHEQMLMTRNKANGAIVDSSQKVNTFSSRNNLNQTSESDIQNLPGSTNANNTYPISSATSPPFSSMKHAGDSRVPQRSIVTSPGTHRMATRGCKFSYAEDDHGFDPCLWLDELEEEKSKKLNSVEETSLANSCIPANKCTAEMIFAAKKRKRRRSEEIESLRSMDLFHMKGEELPSARLRSSMRRTSKVKSPRQKRCPRDTFNQTNDVQETKGVNNTVSIHKNTAIKNEPLSQDEDTVIDTGSVDSYFETSLKTISDLSKRKRRRSTNSTSSDQKKSDEKESQLPKKVTRTIDNKSLSTTPVLPKGTIQPLSTTDAVNLNVGKCEKECMSLHQHGLAQLTHGPEIRKSKTPSEERHTSTETANIKLANGKSLEKAEISNNVKSFMSRQKVSVTDDQLNKADQTMRNGNCSIPKVVSSPNSLTDTPINIKKRRRHSTDSDVDVEMVDIPHSPLSKPFDDESRKCPEASTNPCKKLSAVTVHPSPNNEYHKDNAAPTPLQNMSEATVQPSSSDELDTDSRGPKPLKKMSAVTIQPLSSYQLDTGSAASKSASRLSSIEVSYSDSNQKAACKELASKIMLKLKTFHSAVQNVQLVFRRRDTPSTTEGQSTLNYDTLSYAINKQVGCSFAKHSGNINQPKTRRRSCSESSSTSSAPVQKLERFRSLSADELIETRDLVSPESAESYVDDDILLGSIEDKPPVHAAETPSQRKVPTSVSVTSNNKPLRPAESIHPSSHTALLSKCSVVVPSVSLPKPIPNKIKSFSKSNVNKEQRQPAHNLDADVSSDGNETVRTPKKSLNRVTKPFQLDQIRRSPASNKKRNIDMSANDCAISPKKDTQHPFNYLHRANSPPNTLSLDNKKSTLSKISSQTRDVKPEKKPKTKLSSTHANREKTTPVKSPISPAKSGCRQLSVRALSSNLDSLAAQYKPFVTAQAKLNNDQTKPPASNTLTPKRKTVNTIPSVSQCVIRIPQFIYPPLSIGTDSVKSSKTADGNQTNVLTKAAKPIAALSLTSSEQSKKTIQGTSMFQKLKKLPPSPNAKIIEIVRPKLPLLSSSPPETTKMDSPSPDKITKPNSGLVQSPKQQIRSVDKNKTDHCISKPLTDKQPNSSTPSISPPKQTNLSTLERYDYHMKILETSLCLPPNQKECKQEVKRQIDRVTPILKKPKTLTLAEELALKRQGIGVDHKDALVRRRGRRPHLPDPNNFYLQEGCCLSLPKLPKCRDCKFAREETQRFCRFTMFRRLYSMPKSGKVYSKGFSSPEQACEKDLLHWVAIMPVSLEVDHAIYILKYAANQFLKIVKEENEAYRLGTKSNAVAWKRAVQGVRELCDVCATTIFNIHWVCEKCGFGVCLDCYYCKMEHDARLSTEGTRSRTPFIESSAWLSCAPGVCHRPQNLTVTQIIPRNVLWVLRNQVVLLCRMIGVPTQNINNEKRRESFLSDGTNSRRISLSTASSVSVENSVPKGDKNTTANGGIETDKISQSNKTTFESSEGSCKSKPNGSLSTLNALDVLAAVATNSSSDTKEKQQSNYVVNIPIGIAVSSLQPSFPSYYGMLCDNTLLWLKDGHHKASQDLFLKHWKKGEPVVVSGITDRLNRDLWTPASFEKEFGEETADVVNCLNGRILPGFSVRKFWKGFESITNRPFHDSRNRMLLKLKDWPPGADFSDKMPVRFNDLMQALPFHDYTQRDGIFNLVTRLPDFFAKPDLGPKMYNAYGSASFPSAGTTNLHLDMSDAVNVMVYVGIPQDDESDMEIQDTFTTVDLACCRSTQRRIRQPKEFPGALWHIYRSQDADEIRVFLKKVAQERKMHVSTMNDPIHDQAFYLDADLRDRLQKEHNVIGWAICQCLGDAVFIPAGAPHQVLNLHSCIKVAEDFVTPENIDKCCQLTQEFRHLSDQHTNHEDKLQVKNILFHAMKDAVAALQNYKPTNNKNTEKERPTIN